jgi:hypothetical protein
MKNIPLLVVALIAIAALVVALTPAPAPEAAKPAPLPQVVQDPRIPVLEREVADLTTAVADLRQRLDHSTSASAPATDPGTPDDDHIKQVVDDELKAQMQRFRPPGGGGFGQRNQDPAAIQKDIADKVGVDADTATKLQALVTASRDNIRSAFRNGTPPDQIQPLIQAEKQKDLTQAQTFLNADQQQKFSDWLDSQVRGGSRPGGGGPGGPGGAPPAPDAGATQLGVKF